MEKIEGETVINYYTGAKWFLVKINGSETYISETRFNHLKAQEKLKEQVWSK